MRIAMVGWEFPPFVSGGLGVHCFELTRALCRKGIEIDFFMPEVEGTVEPSCERLRIIGVGKTALRPYLFVSKSTGKIDYKDRMIDALYEYNARCVKAVCMEHEVRNYDLIHAHDWLTSRAGWEAKGALFLPLIQTFHSTEFDRTSWPWDYILDIERSAARKADLIIAVSRRTKEQVLRLGADEKKIRVVYNGVDRNKFMHAKADCAAIGNFRKKKKVVLFLGRLTEQKGPVQFLHAAKKVLSVNPNVIFVLAGKGEMLPLLISMSLELGIANSVRFLGYVPEEEQKSIYKVADVYVMPSTSEPFGITALEAMSSGLPIIISKTSGVAEIVKTAIKVDFWDINAMAEKMLAVLKYQPLSRAMSHLACEEASKYSWERTADDTIKVYNEAISIKATAIAR